MAGDDPRLVRQLRLEHVRRPARLLHRGRPAAGRVAASTPAPATGPCPRATSRSTCRARLYFAGESPQWGGGVAFYDHATPGLDAARGYLVTAEPVRRHRRPGDVPRSRRTGTRSRSWCSRRSTAAGTSSGRAATRRCVEVGRLRRTCRCSRSPRRTASTTSSTRRPRRGLPRDGRATGLRESRGWDDERRSRRTSRRSTASRGVGAADRSLVCGHGVLRRRRDHPAPARGDDRRQLRAHRRRSTATARRWSRWPPGGAGPTPSSTPTSTRWPAG